METLLVIAYIGSVAETIITKDYVTLADNTLFTLLAITTILKSRIIKNQYELIKVKDDTIKLQDELIARQARWIREVKKIMKENQHKNG